MIQITIDSSDEGPIYRQIMRQIREGLAGGLIGSGTQLPSHRDLAKQLAIAQVTVKKAYDELELLGLVETRRGRGTFTVSNLPEQNKEERRNEIKTTARRMLSQALLAGLTLQDVVKVLIEVEREMRRS